MNDTGLVATHSLRERFSAAMSAMYRAEVPAYGTLLELVARINDQRLQNDPELAAELDATAGRARLASERHGAIRVGRAEELATLRRFFAVLGMFPVGYYDLSVAGVPVHATAFRPLEPDALAANPFRLFTSLLRLDLIDDAGLRAEAEAILGRRRIFSNEALRLLRQAEADGGLAPDAADAFVAALRETFRWHGTASVDSATYDRLYASHPVVADVVSFPVPHINHLTPRTLDIDAAQAAMPDYGIAPKAVVEGPPPRRCPILLRQTAFKALEEPVAFPEAGGGYAAGRHRARFGEIEQRGAALTAAGRERYDACLAAARAAVAPAPDGSNAQAYTGALESAFADFPDDWETLRAEGLAYFQYSVTPAGEQAPPLDRLDSGIETLIEQGLVRADPIVYEDFLPVSAAGIFQSNLGDRSGPAIAAEANRQAFEAALGARPADELALYASQEARSIDRCLERFAPDAPREGSA